MLQNNMIQPKPKPEPRSFDTCDIIFAWFSYIVAYLFCRTVPVSSNTLGGFILIFILYTFSAIFFKIKGIKLNLLSILTAISAVIVSASLIVSSNAFIHFFAYVYALVAFTYFIFSSTGNSVTKGFSNAVIIDWFKAIFIVPFYSVSEFQLFRSMFFKRSKRSMGILLKLFIGICAAIVPTGIILLLLSYDDDFTSLLGKIFDFDFSIFSHIFSLLFAIPIAIYSYGLYISSIDKKPCKALDKEHCEKISRDSKVAPAVTVVTTVTPILLVYVIFFISQWKYYISGFTGLLPRGFSYAEYAREGFFQLCTVCIINFIIISTIIILMKKSRFSSAILKTLTVIFSLFTLVLISTAVAKMVMYIDYYGLTPKRVYATWFMLVLAIVFVAIALSRFISKIKIVSFSVSVLIIAFTLLSLCNVDAIIAKYNVDRYMNGTLETVDISAFYDLGDAGIPELVRLAEYLDENKGTNIISDVKTKPLAEFETSEEADLVTDLTIELAFTKDVFTNRDQNIFHFTINSAKAEASLRNAGIIK